MSKQSEAKARQGYNPKPLARCCRTCRNVLSKMGEPDRYHREAYEIALTCAIGGFAVKAQAVCKEWEGKEAG